MSNFLFLLKNWKPIHQSPYSHMAAGGQSLEGAFPYLNQASLFVPISVWSTSLALLACWLQWVLDLPQTLFPVSSDTCSCSAENPFVRPERADHRLSSWPCLLLTPGLCSRYSAWLKWLSPNNSSVHKPSISAGKVLQNVRWLSISAQCSDVTLCPN